MKKYLSSFPYVEKSTERHRHIAAKHWELVFGNKTKGEGRGGGHLAENPNKINKLYDIFYHYLEEDGSELKHVFRSSMHVLGRVLVHISAGMRVMLSSDRLMDKIALLTKTHRRFGVKPYHYDLARRELLPAMEKVSGPSNWSPEISEAWCQMHVHVSVILIRDQLKAEKRWDKVQQLVAKNKGRMPTSHDSAMAAGQPGLPKRKAFSFRFHIYPCQECTVGAPYEIKAQRP